MLGIVREFFELPSEDKAPYYSDDARKPIRLCTGKVFEKDATLYWRDYLKLVVHPVEEWMHLWPEKPTKFREIVARYAEEVRGLSMRLLRVICEGLGLEDDYLSGDLSAGCLMQVNHYPACPDPSLTLGLPKHTDASLMTLLLQGNVSGLQALYGGEWIEVEPLPYAFVINFGYQLEFITNGIIKGVEHRAATNSTASRTTVASFVIPELDCFISPAPSIIDELTPRLYRPFPFKEFLGAYLSSLGNKQATLEPFRVKN